MHQREGSLLRCKAVLRHASHGLRRAAGMRVCAHAITPPPSLSIGRRRSTRACGARATSRAGCSRPMPYERPLHQREASLLRCKAVLRHTSCGLAHSRLARVRTRDCATMCARAATARALCGEEAQQARLRHCAGWSRLHTLKGPRTREEASLVRCKTVVPRAGLGLAHGRLVCACVLMRARHRARSLWGGGAARALATRARRASQIGNGNPSLEGRCASTKALSFGARPWWHASALASRAAGLRMCARERPPRALSVGRRRSRRACRARAPRCAGMNRPSGSRRPSR